MAKHSKIIKEWTIDFIKKGILGKRDSRSCLHQSKILLLMTPYLFNTKELGINGLYYCGTRH